MRDGSKEVPGPIMASCGFSFGVELPRPVSDRSVAVSVHVWM